LAETRTPASPLVQYYGKRAAEYERIYDKPERQRELEWLRQRIPEIFRDRTVLEVACGTGYWTQCIARTARKVHACDINEAVLDIARDKPLPRDRVAFFKADAATFAGVPPECDAAFAGFWWSHVKKSELAVFVRNLAVHLQPGARVAILDNTFAPGSSTPISRRDAEGNTYQQRKLGNGEAYEVLKNFPTAGELRDAVSPVAREAHLESLMYYWLLVFQLR
jgi:ubiquinone/menaquinone biosynthesis C-methylase UbiE